MLSDEEKKEYEELKSLLYQGTLTQYGKRKLIDIIEKQSKEIEELKYKVREHNCIEAHEQVKQLYIPKDKIKAKIEEMKKEMLNEENSLELFYRKKYCKEVLQSLLDKEE